MSPTLYSYAESGNSYKVRLLSSLLHIPLWIVEVDFLADEQHSPGFLALNPEGEVPVLVDERDDKDTKVVLTDSAAILVYLAGTYPSLEGRDSSSFWSADPLAQAQVTEWLAFAVSWVQFGVFTTGAILSFGGAYNGLGRGGE
ncbi:uncharacterized protein KD926_005541 [Aspergillus affinis]|uniref:uncharacterized protein n=1 Tax=Aspergillus affinis TaxID=1070780 RepID=UPI0022FE38E9|nr:uncharacterized protein KD926_005541 [Aspergillus affinis]KAI9042462.1 hypothetical protein KD926_005541 [Aspergillus affinis]